MAGVRRNWKKPLAVAALLFSAGTSAFAQSADTGSLTGRLTDLYSAPVEGAMLVVRNAATGAETRTTTGRNGAYRITGLGPGEYTVEAASPRLGQGHVEGIMVAAGHEARVQTAMEFQPPLAEPIQLVFHDIEPATPVLDITVAIHPMQTLPLTGRRWQDVARVRPETVALAINVEVATEPLQTLALSAQILEVPLRLQPQAVAEAAGSEAGIPLGAVGRETAAIKTVEAASGLDLARTGGTGQVWNELNGVGKTWAGARAIAMGLAAVSALRTGIELREPLPKPIRTAFQDSGPVGPVVTTTITGEQLRALPSSGRRWQDFVLETPTAAEPAGGDGQTSFRGAGQEPAAITVDGANRGMAFGAMGTGSAGGGGEAAISEAAIREVQTEAGNVGAAGGRAAGGRMNVATQRGANGLHGQGFMFDRQNTWGARNPFTQWVKETAPATQTTSPVFTAQAYTPPDHEMTWGIGLGGHIRRNKLHWFAAIDSFQRNYPGLATVKHPSEFFAQPSNDQMQVLSARLGLSSSNPVAAGLAAYSTMLETLGGLLGPAPRTATRWTGFGRIDWEATERHRFTLEGTGARRNSPGGGLSRVAETNGSHSFGSSLASEEWLLGRWEAFITPNLLAVTQASVGRAINAARPAAPSAYEQSLTQKTWGQLPQIGVDSRYGFTLGNPSRFGAGRYPDEHNYQAQEMVDWVRGNLLVKAGIDVGHISDVTSQLRNQAGTYSYANLENFVSDALAFSAFGISGQLNPSNQHNCDQTGRVWRDARGELRGLGYLPCYSYYSQVMGPTNWHLSTNDWAGFATAQLQPRKTLVLSAGLRWEWEQLPPPIAAVRNPELPLTSKLPSLGNNWGPRLSLALGTGESHWPVLRLGYGMYFGRIANATLEAALTQTGSPNGDLSFFIRPTDNLNGGGAPPFPYVLAGEPTRMVKPGAVEFAPLFRNAEIHQALAALEETLPGHVRLTASAMVSLGRRLPISIDTNVDPSVNPQTITYAVVDGNQKGPIKTPQITVPFYASWPSTTSATGFGGRLNPGYQQVTEIMSRANSTYEAAMVKVTRNSRRGMSVNAHYTYAHAMDWNPNESTRVAGSDVLDPANFRQEYGTSNLDVRHSAVATVIWEAPWKLRKLAGRLGNGWMLSGIGQFRSGLPYTMRTSGSLAKEFDTRTGAAIVALGPGMNGSGGDNRVYGVGRNTYRYPLTWKADLRLGRRFDLGHMRQLELLAESFNLFNHQNVTQLEAVGYYIQSGTLNGGLPTLNFLTGLKPNSTAFGQPLNINATNFYRERQIQLGLKIRF